MEKRNERCSTCLYFCQDVDPENRLYFDDKSGECRKNPPMDHFLWQKTRPYHWCGGWRSKEVKASGSWRAMRDFPPGDAPVLLYRQGRQCKDSGMVVAYWNASFEKWHDGADQLFDRGEFTHWMELPDEPKG